MKILTIKIFYLLFFILTTSCQDKYYTVDTTSFDKFMLEKEAKLDSLPIFCETGYLTTTYDSLLLIQTARKNACVDVYSLNDYKLLTSICMIGRGHNEYILPILSNQFKNGEDGHILLNTFNSNVSLYVVDLTESIAQNRTVIVRKEDISKKISEKIHSFYELSDETYFSQGQVTYKDVRDAVYGVPKYQYIDKDGNKKEMTSFEKALEINIGAAESAYSSSGTISPDRKKFVNAYTNLDIIDIIDIDNMKIKGIKHVDSYDFQEMKSIFSSLECTKERLYIYNCGVVATNDFFITLYLGENFWKMAESGKYSNSSIRVFDWKGTPLLKINFDCGVTHVSYNEKQRSLFFCYNDSVFKYNMDADLKSVGL